MNKKESDIFSTIYLNIEGNIVIHGRSGSVIEMAAGAFLAMAPIFQKECREYLAAHRESDDKTGSADVLGA